MYNPHSLIKFAYQVHVDTYGLYSYNVKEGQIYDYIEQDGTLTNLGKCVHCTSDSRICWHDGPSWWEKITFENTSKPRYNINNGGSGTGGNRLPLSLRTSTS